MHTKPLYAIGRAIINLSDRPAGRVSFAVVLGCVGAGVALLAHQLTEAIGVPLHAIHDAAAVIIGIFLALLTYVEISAVRERRRRVVDDLRLVAELNHVLRNSLEAIQYAAKLSADDQHVQIINDCVRRIDLTVRELFPIVVDPRRSERRPLTRAASPQGPRVD